MATIFDVNCAKIRVIKSVTNAQVTAAKAANSIQVGGANTYICGGRCNNKHSKIK